MVDEIDVMDHETNEQMHGVENPFKVTFYDSIKFPYVIVNKFLGNFSLINIHTLTIQTLVSAESLRGGICIRNTKTSSDDSFDFHFASVKLEEDKLWYEYHHRMQVRHDMIKVMKDCGQVPFMTLKETRQMIIKSNLQREENKKLLKE